MFVTYNRHITYDFNNTCYYKKTNVNIYIFQAQ